MSVWCNILTQISGLVLMMTRHRHRQQQSLTWSLFITSTCLFFFPPRMFFFYFRNGRMTRRTRMTGGLCYSETFKAELSLVILRLTCQKVPLTLKHVLLNSCMVLQLMCTSINKRCFWCRGRYLLTFIHTKPIMTVQTEPHLKIKKNLASVPSSCEWLFCSRAVELLLLLCKQSGLRWLIWCFLLIIHWFICSVVLWLGILRTGKNDKLHIFTLCLRTKGSICFFSTPRSPFIKCTK